MYFPFENQFPLIFMVFTTTAIYTSNRVPSLNVSENLIPSMNAFQLKLQNLYQTGLIVIQRKR